MGSSGLKVSGSKRWGWTEMMLASLPWKGGSAWELRRERGRNRESLDIYYRDSASIHLPHHITLLFESLPAFFPPIPTHQFPEYNPSDPWL